MGYEHLNQDFRCPKHIYDGDGAAAQFAAKRDAGWFEENHKSVWRVRSLIEGECPAIDAILAADVMKRGLVIVINHERSQDKRASGKIGVYPVGYHVEADLMKVKASARSLAARMVKHFKRRSSFPDLQPGQALMVWS